MSKTCPKRCWLLSWKPGTLVQARTRHRVPPITAVPFSALNRQRDNRPITNRELMLDHLA